MARNLSRGEDFKVLTTQPTSQSLPALPTHHHQFFFSSSQKWHFSYIQVLPNQETHHFSRWPFPSLDISALLRRAFLFCQSVYSTVTKSLNSSLHHVPIPSHLGSAPHRFPSGTLADGEAPLWVMAGLREKEKREWWMTCCPTVSTFR